jgi:hypothetical protein
VKKKRKLAVYIAVALAAAAVSGITIYAATSAGTQSDPFVTLSYLNNKFAPQLMQELNGEISAATDRLMKQLDEKLAETPGGGETRPESPNVFKVVTLSKGQTLKCSVGAELLLRIGSASVVGQSPGLVDSTDGSALGSGGVLTVNHLYMVTIEGNGIKAGADTVKIMARGEYTVS